MTNQKEGSLAMALEAVIMLIVFEISTVINAIVGLVR
jgi:hypothetical protein